MNIYFIDSNLDYEECGMAGCVVVAESEEEALTYVDKKDYPKTTIKLIGTACDGVERDIVLESWYE